MIFLVVLTSRLDTFNIFAVSELDFACSWRSSLPYLLHWRRGAVEKVRVKVLKRTFGGKNATAEVSFGVFGKG